MKTFIPLLAGALAVPVLALSVPGSAQALNMEDPGPTSDWTAWYGCWEASDTVDADESFLVCFEPLADGAGVEIRTVVEGEVVAVEQIVADGLPVPAEDGGCVGERFASWSADGHRVFVGSELICGEGVTRRTSGVMALTADGREWLEIHAVEAGDRDAALGVRRFVPASPATVAEFGIEAADRERGLAVRTARSAHSAPLTGDAVVEVVEVAGAPVARALITELGHPFTMSTAMARDLLARGVTADVLDVMVAVTYPERFQIAGTSWEAAEQERTVATRQTRQARVVAPWPDRYAYAPWGYSPWRHSWYYGSAFGYNPYAWGGGYWGGFGPGRVIVVQPEVRDRRRSILDPNRGYSSGASSDRSATQRGTPSTNRAPASQPASTRTPRDTPAASPAPRVTPRGAASSGSSGSDRRARPRTSGGGGG